MTTSPRGHWINTLVKLGGLSPERAADLRYADDIMHFALLELQARLGIEPGSREIQASLWDCILCRSAFKHDLPEPDYTIPPRRAIGGLLWTYCCRCRGTNSAVNTVTSKLSATIPLYFHKVNLIFTNYRGYPLMVDCLLGISQNARMPGSRLFRRSSEAGYLEPRNPQRHAGPIQRRMGHGPFDRQR